MLKMFFQSFAAILMMGIPLVGFASPFIAKKAIAQMRELQDASGKNTGILASITLHKIIWWCFSIVCIFIQIFYLIGTVLVFSRSSLG